MLNSVVLNKDCRNETKENGAAINPVRELRKTSMTERKYYTIYALINHFNQSNRVKVKYIFLTMSW